MEPKKVTDSLTEQIHVVIYPDINGFGRLFGGQLLKWIDEVAGATARRHCGNNATMEVRVDTYKENPDGTRHPINRAYFVMVNMGEDGKPTEAPPLLLNPDDPAEQMEWDNALKRRELRLMRRKEGF